MARRHDPERRRRLTDATTAAQRPHMPDEPPRAPSSPLRDGPLIRRLLTGRTHHPRAIADQVNRRIPPSGTGWPAAPPTG
ncbi:hypothetical protein ACWGIB_15195 [Streptomyces xiamenensis]